MTTPTLLPKPPLPWLLAYRILGLRLPAEYNAWVAADVTSKHFLTRRISRSVLWAAVILALYVVAQTATFHAPHRWSVTRAFLFAMVLALLSSGATLVRRTLRWQRIDRHGRPVAPRGLAALANDQAVVLATALLVAYTGAAALYVHRFLRPKTATCDKPSSEAVSRLRAGLKDPGTEIVKPQAVPFGDSTLVVSLLKKPGDVKPSAGVWIVGDDAIYEVRTPEQAELSATSFPPPPNVDRLAGDALQKAVNCLSASQR